MIDWTGHIKLIDFGLSKRLPSKEALTYSFVGSEGYLAPEVMAKEPYGILADIYSIGSLLYEMLHGFPPFTAYDQNTRTYRFSKSNELKLRADLSAEVKELIFQLLNKVPKDRLTGFSNTMNLLNHPWFLSEQKKLELDFLLDHPFLPDLTEDPTKVGLNQQKLTQILSDINGRIKSTR
jgi:serine/threonine protein kinase